jgi:magnesium chelatase subunit I
MRDSASAQEMLHKLRSIQGLLDKLSVLGLSGKEPSEMLVSGAEFILEGLYAHKRIGRSEERTFIAGEKQPPREKPRLHDEDDEVPDLRRHRRPFN